MEITNDSGSVLLYDSIKNLPIERYAALNKLVLQDVGFGATFEDVKKRLTALTDLIGKENIAGAKLELSNLYFALFQSIQKTDIKSLCFLCFVKKIGTDDVGDIESEDEQKRCREYFNKIGLTVGDVEDTISALKKKLMEN